MRIQRAVVALVGALAAAVTVAHVACAPENFTFAGADGSADGGGFDATNTAQCDGSAQPVPDDQAVWVSGTLGSDSSSCTRASPCQTINAALAKAQSQGLHFAYLDSSTFSEYVSLGAALSGITIQGGWQSAAGWTSVCDDSTTRIVAPADGGSAAIDIQGADNVTLRLLTVESKQAGNVGESVYAVRVMSAMNVVLDNVALYAGSGGSGSQGGLGAADGGCSQWPAAGIGAPGDGGAPGALAVPGDGGFALSSGGAGATGLLLDLLKASAPSRIVNVSSTEAQSPSRLDMNDLQFERRKYSAVAAYRQSKLLMNAFTFELARRLAGTGVTANCLHPGAVATNIWNPDLLPLIGGLIVAVVKPFLLNSKQGAAVSLYLATSPEVAQVSGEYFVKSKPAKSNPLSRDPKLMAEVWLCTEKMTSMPLA